jgi:cytochrome c-type biogenesis protein CcmH
MKAAPFAATVSAVTLLLAAAAWSDAARRGDGAAATAAAWSAGDPATVQRLESHLAQTPRDARGWVLLARLHFAADRFEAAARAYERALEASPKVARDPQVWCELADALGMAQGGRLAGRPRELIDKALALKGSHPRALEMAGSAAVEARDYARALSYWEPLLAQLDPHSREHRELAGAIERVRRADGSGSARG